MRKIAVVFLILMMVLLSSGCDTSLPGDDTLGKEGYQKLFAQYLAAQGICFTTESVSDGVSQPVAEIWVKGDKARIILFFDTPGSEAILYTNRLSSEVIQYMPASKSAMVLTKSHDLTEFPLTFLTEEILQSYTVTKNQLVDGTACTMLHHKDDTKEVTIYVSNMNDFPFRMDITTANGTQKTYYRNVRYVDIADSVFELPDGVAVYHLDTHYN